MIPGRPKQTRAKLVRLAQTRAGKSRTHQTDKNKSARTYKIIPYRTFTKPNKPKQKSLDQISLEQTKEKRAKPDKT